MEKLSPKKRKAGKRNPGKDPQNKKRARIQKPMPKAKANLSKEFISDDDASSQSSRNSADDFVDDGQQPESSQMMKDRERANVASAEDIINARMENSFQRPITDLRQNSSDFNRTSYQAENEEEWINNENLAPGAHDPEALHQTSFYDLVIYRNLYLSIS